MINIQRQAYQSDLKGQEWEIIYPLLLQISTVGSRGRPQEWPLREVLNAIFYILKASCTWRMMPHDLPPWETVYYHYRRLSKDYEELPENSEAFIYAAMTHLMVRRLARCRII